MRQFIEVNSLKSPALDLFFAESLIAQLATEATFLRAGVPLDLSDPATVWSVWSEAQLTDYASISSDPARFGCALLEVKEVVSLSDELEVQCSYFNCGLAF